MPTRTAVTPWTAGAGAGFAALLAPAYLLPTNGPSSSSPGTDTFPLLSAGRCSRRATLHFTLALPGHHYILPPSQSSLGRTDELQSDYRAGRSGILFIAAHTTVLFTHNFFLPALHTTPPHPPSHAGRTRSLYTAHGALTMSTIQNLKNFIRHGKQARDARSPPAQAQVSNVHAHQQQGFGYGGVQDQHNQHGISDPNVYGHKPLQARAPHEDYSAAAVDNRHVAAKAGHAAAGAVDRQQKRDQRDKESEREVLERLVAEERDTKNRLPRYPGLERWTLIEKMGDGAFSNVYRARDNNGQYGEAAIKVVRKFEMNSTQVCELRSCCFSARATPHCCVLTSPA